MECAEGFGAIPFRRGDCGRLSALASGNRLALLRDRAGVALSDGGAAGVRSEPPRSGQTHRALRAVGARSAGTVLRRRFNKDLTKSIRRPTVAAQISAAPIVVVAVDLAEGSAELNDAFRDTSGRILAALPAARLACLNILKLGRHHHRYHPRRARTQQEVDRLVSLRHWAEPLRLGKSVSAFTCSRRSIRPMRSSNSHKPTISITS